MNPYAPKLTKIKKIIEETPTIRTFVLEGKPIEFEAGQFAELTVPGVGEAPFTPSSSPYAPDLEFTIMKVGRVTRALFELKEGEIIGVRGPFGKPYPLNDFKKKDVFIVGGGVGFAPLRSLFLALIENIKEYKKIYIRYGARTPKDIVYKYLIPGWQKIKNVDILLTVDVGDEEWKGRVGVVTTILDEIPVDVKTTPAIVCGPPLMMKFTTQRLVEAGFKDSNIYLSMEKNMSCGIGKCNHCRVGKFYVCKDGPVLTWKDVKDIEDPFL
ncbi:MAG: FAD/NAD(P)-binding protein [candidate division WOR-3 bacterium]|nr:FAD/NAD(P)-binding protein [candidate division WOR-3 bacterium]